MLPSRSRLRPRIKMNLLNFNFNAFLDLESGYFNGSAQGPQVPGYSGPITTTTTNNKKDEEGNVRKQNILLAMR